MPDTQHPPNKSRWSARTDFKISVCAINKSWIVFYCCSRYSDSMKYTNPHIAIYSVNISRLSSHSHCTRNAHIIESHSMILELSQPRRRIQIHLFIHLAASLELMYQLQQGHFCAAISEQEWEYVRQPCFWQSIWSGLIWWADGGRSSMGQEAWEIAWMAAAPACRDTAVVMRSTSLFAHSRLPIDLMICLISWNSCVMLAACLHCQAPCTHWLK